MEGAKGDRGRDQGEASPSGVTLLVKSPAQRHPDLLLPARRSWSVRRLKAELRRLHPDGPDSLQRAGVMDRRSCFSDSSAPMSRVRREEKVLSTSLSGVMLCKQPPEDSQRLIYSGKLLPDDICLQEVLAKHEMVHAVHLVCNSKNVPHVQETDGKVAEAKKESTACSQGPFVLPSAPAGNQRENSCNQPFTTEEPGTRPHLTQHTFQGMNPGYHSYTTYRMLQFWFQQVYARQYYMQYMAASAASSELPPTQSTQEIPVGPVAPPAPLPGAFPAGNQPGNQNAPPPVNPGVNQNLRMNAQGGPLMEEDEEGNRDWLDWLYSATLFYVFVNIVYFYSSMSRFLMVMVGTLLMYLHQIGWFPFRRRPAQNNIPPQAAVNQDQNNNLQQEENVDGQGEMEGLEAVPEREPAAPSFMSTAWLFFKAFFASLLPEGPPAVAN